MKQKSFLSLLMSILQQLIGYVSLYFVSRYMGPGPLGIVASALAYTTVFMNFADWGYGLAHVKKVSEGKDLGKCIGTFATLKITMITFAGIICFLSFHILSHYGKKLPVPNEYMVVLYIILAGSMLDGFARIPQTTFAARLEKAKEWSSLIVHKFFTSGFRTLTAILGLGVVYLAWSNLAGTILALLVAFWFLRKLPISKFDYELFKDYSRYALPAFFVGISSSLATQLDTVFISMLSNVEQVGYYSGAKGIVLVISYINIIFVSLLLPSYSRMNANNDMSGIRALANKIERYISFPLSAIGMFIFFFSSPLQRMLLGENFGPSAIIAKILIVNSMLNILAQPYTAQIMGMNKVRLATVLSILILGLNLVFYFILIPASLSGFTLFGLGAQGAATSLLISNVIGTGLFRYYAFRLSNSKPNNVIIISLICSILVFASLYYIFKDWSWTTNFFVLCGLALTGAMIYVGILVLIKQFRRSDLQFYLEVLNLQKLGLYVKKELKN